MPRANEYQINIRTNKERYMYLHEMENYSQYLNDLIDKDRLEKADPIVIDQQINALEQQIKALKERKKKPPVDEEKVKEILEFGYETYCRDRVEVEDRYNISWIKTHVIKNLKEHGCTKYKAEDILGAWKTRYQSTHNWRDEV